MWHVAMKKRRQHHYPSEGMHFLDYRVIMPFLEDFSRDFYAIFGIFLLPFLGGFHVIFIAIFGRISRDCIAIFERISRDFIAIF